MTPLQPDVLYNCRYDTKSTCSKLGIGRSTLHRYRRAGLIKASYHRANLRPYYTGSEIIRLWNMTS
jgi:predicted site-specific integrase-resolvase